MLLLHDALSLFAYCVEECLLRNLPPSWKCVVWNEMCRAPVKLEFERIGCETYVTIPLVGAWNGGYMTGF